jgi:gliding motility-associated-like protein
MHGRLIINPNFTVTYVPDSGFRGSDNFSYQIAEFVGTVIGYSDTATVCIDVVDTVPVCFFPNGISPNGDGINDVFVFPCNDQYPNASLLIFNRWGDKIWEVDNGYKNDWGGTNLQGTPVPDGTYYFVYKYNDGSGRSTARFVVVYRGQKQ